MRVKIMQLFVVLALGVGVLSFLPSAPAQAGSNGQQLYFYNYSNNSTISWVRVEGTNNNNQHTIKSFSPNSNSYSLNGWWWKGRTSVDWRMADGRTGGCLFDVPVSQTGDWSTVGVDRNGNICWFSSP